MNWWKTLATFLALPIIEIVVVAQGSGDLFQERAREVNLPFEHFIGATGDLYLPEIMGSGVGMFDYDGDGDLDLYLLQGALLNPEKPLDTRVQTWQSGERPVNRLFRNELFNKNGKGALRFTDVTSGAGVGDRGYGMGVATADYDGDGHMDLYVTNFGANILYRNNGDGTFTDVTVASGTAENRWSTGAAFLDYDRDGDLDLFVLNYVDFTVAGNKTCYDAVGALDYCNPNLYRPLPDRLFRNEGNGKFTDVTESSGIGANIGPGLGVSVGDFNLDGWLDVYVANDGAANFLWINAGDGTFLEDALLAGAAFNGDGTPEGSMGLAAGDFDDDGDEDLFMTHLRMETNTLFANDGKGNFHDETTPFGLADISYPFTSFGTRWFDYDNDGHQDLFIANGAVYNLESLRGDPYPYHQTNQLIHNEGGGRFTEVSASAGGYFKLSEVSRGAAFGDLDEDGDLDIVVTNNKGPVRLLENRAAAGNHWIQVSLADDSSTNRQAYGASVVLVTRAGMKFFRRVGTDGSYLSASDPRVHFGRGKEDRIERIEVRWLDGSQEAWPALPVDSRVVLKKGSGSKAGH